MKFTRTLIALSAATLMATSAMAMEPAEYKAAKDQISADYKANKQKCDALQGNAKDVCVAGLCRPNESRVPECKMNADCAAGSECVDAQCRAPCFAGSDCAACSDGPVCALGHCMTQREANPQCTLSVDCGQSVTCRDGACAQ